MGLLRGELGVELVVEVVVGQELVVLADGLTVRNSAQGGGDDERDGNLVVGDEVLGNDGGLGDVVHGFTFVVGVSLYPM